MYSSMVRFFSADSFFNIYSSLCSILIRSLNSAKSCELFWIRFTYLLRADFTYSYSALKCSNLFSVSSCFLVRSFISSSFTFSYSLVYLTSDIADEALRAMDSLIAVKSLTSFWVIATFLLSYSSSFSSFCIYT